jgi:DNA-directed RNA polymerase specialized sigma24 family protein
MDWPPDDELLEAWRRLVADPDTGTAFVDAVHRPLVAALAGRQRNAHPDDVYTAASNALLWFLEHADRYDPDQSPLRSFMLLVAERRLLNVIASEARHRRRTISGDFVEDLADERNDGVDDDPLSFDRPELQPVIAALSDVERRVLDLMRGGERDTPVFAEVLGITDGSADEQRHEVKKVKDRIIARLRRAAGGANG